MLGIEWWYRLCWGTPTCGEKRPRKSCFKKCHKTPPPPPLFESELYHETIYFLMDLYEMRHGKFDSKRITARSLLDLEKSEKEKKNFFFVSFCNTNWLWQTELKVFWFCQQTNKQRKNTHTKKKKTEGKNERKQKEKGKEGAKCLSFFFFLKQNFLKLLCLRNDCSSGVVQLSFWAFSDWWGLLALHNLLFALQITSILNLLFLSVQKQRENFFLSFFLSFFFIPFLFSFFFFFFLFFLSFSLLLLFRFLSFFSDFFSSLFSFFPLVTRFWIVHIPLFLITFLIPFLLFFFCLEIFIWNSVFVWPVWTTASSCKIAKI